MVDPGYQITNAVALLHTADVYWMLLSLASGIQMAGPNLTPSTFQHALQQTHFPNPYSPQMEGAVGFDGGSYAMTTDAALTWWSDSAAGPYPDGGTGTWCYVAHGRRYSLADWPSGPPGFFQGPCDG
jgi:hypothetical protein